ncbi:prephenate dehydratase [uncultured Acetobacteroides sp.]|uniref:prephenate dehydratase n=1 Tax=uncultured Acetobacteroides sp. TaxID=1760811 RepID=UPI0029F47059|nr:prephenate dehydratase [uncultured Acetobacteroides sp.]
MILEYESPLRVAIQGVRGAFHEIAARETLGNDIIPVECLTFRELVAATESEKVDAALMAIENSVAGGILPNYALLRNSELQIVGEVYLRIVQNLLALPGETVESIKEVESHPMAIQQCTDFLGEHPEWKIIESEDTALSARKISEGEIRGKAAIGSSLAAELFGLNILAPEIESNKENYTRFLILTKKDGKIRNTTSNKASICFSAKHEPGALADILKDIADCGVNLSMLHSLPKVGAKWEYIFHADLVYDSYMQYLQAVKTLNETATYFKVLGEYQAGSEIF